jgi:hypothetical protein
MGEGAQQVAVVAAMASARSGGGLWGLRCSIRPHGSAGPVSTGERAEAIKTRRGAVPAA